MHVLFVNSMYEPLCSKTGNFLFMLEGIFSRARGFCRFEKSNAQSLI